MADIYFPFWYFNQHVIKEFVLGFFEHSAWNHFYTTKCARTLVHLVMARLAGRSGALSFSTFPITNVSKCFKSVRFYRPPNKVDDPKFGRLYFFLGLDPFFFFLLFVGDQPKPLKVKQSIAL